MKADQASNITRDLLPGFLHFISDKKWDDQFEDSFFSDLLRYVAGESEVPEDELENVSHDVLNRLRNIARFARPNVFN